MQSKATTVEEYMDQLPEDKKAAMQKLRTVIKKNLPKGFTEGMSYGMIGFSVPHKLYPAGYHCSPELPLPFLSIAAQKNFIAIYHMGIYADKALYDWFIDAYNEVATSKLDMGKSCIRFKKPDQIPFELFGELAKKMTVQDWITKYEAAFRSGKK